MNTSTLRKVFAATVASGVIGLTSLAGGAASADGGQHEVGHWMGMMPPAAAPIHQATDVTMKRGVIGASESVTVGSSQTPSGDPINPGYIYIRRLDMDAIK